MSEETEKKPRTSGRGVVTYPNLVDCPRCYTVCGWCADYRHQHGLGLPGGRGLRCTIPGMAPEGDACPLCHGSMRVHAITTFMAAATPTQEPTDG